MWVDQIDCVIDCRLMMIYADNLAFRPPIPVPEPPRIINTRPLVPDLSITSDGDSELLSVSSKTRGKPSSKQSVSLSKEKNESRSKKASQEENNNHSGRQCACKDQNQFLLAVLKTQEEQLETLTKQMKELLKINKAQLKKNRQLEKVSVGTMTEDSSNGAPVYEFIDRGRPKQNRQTEPKTSLDSPNFTDSDFHSASVNLSVDQSCQESLIDDAVYEKILCEVGSRLSRSRSEERCRNKRQNHPPRTTHQKTHEHPCPKHTSHCCSPTDGSIVHQHTTRCGPPIVEKHIHSRCIDRYRRSPSPEPIIITERTEKYLTKDPRDRDFRDRLRRTRSSDIHRYLDRFEI